VNIAYADCQTSSRVQLFTFTVLESAPSTDVWFEVRQHWNPSNYLYSCPLLTLCDAPTYTAVCVGLPDSVHWRAVINPSNGVSSDCAPVGVTASTWTTIKNLYRG